MTSGSSRNERLTIVIFGASGDLTRRKLAPALFHLQRFGALPQMCHFVGVARSDIDDEPFRSTLAESMGALSSMDRAAWDDFTGTVSSGKALSSKTSEIAVQFRPPPHTIFDTHSADVTPNLLQISIQPHEGVHLTFENKKPGTRMGTAPETLEYHFPPQVILDSYDRLLLDAVEGDRSLFTRSDEIEMSWQIIDPFIESWHNSLKSQFYPYEKGSPGPSAADEFLGDERSWHHHEIR
jgi:glucose-6-phosphate 1-dehydrogenase